MIRAIIGLIVFGSLALVLPPESPADKSAKMDWFGSFLGIAGLILFNLVWKYDYRTPAA